MTSFQLVILFSALFPIALSFFFEIHNNVTDLLIDRKGGPLLVHFDFSFHPLIQTSSDVSLMTSFGLAVNGSICERFMGGIDEIEIVVTAKCLPSESFWFSMMAFTDEGMTLSSTALYVPRQQQQPQQQQQHQQHDEQITLVLPLTFNDVTRSFVLLDSLTLLTTTNTPPLIREMLIFVPPSELSAVQSLLLGATMKLSFPVTIAAENVLLDPYYIQTTGVYPYAVQMAIKLLVSEIVSTSFYLTLDADVVLLRSFVYGDVVDPWGRAVYDHEGRLEVHPLWWEGSERYLRRSGVMEGWGEEEEEEKEMNGRKQQGFGVTPALLSTYGARLTLHLLAASMDARALDQWVRDFGQHGVVWSEYTLYALTLHHYQVFQSLHVPDASAAHLLHCHDVWHPQDLPWDSVAAHASPRQCLFSVVQSSSHISPREVYMEYMRGRGIYM